VHAGKDARHIEQIARAGELELVFIDADHQHPRPTLDKKWRLPELPWSMARHLERSGYSKHGRSERSVEEISARCAFHPICGLLFRSP
jgi:hypothetical protein